MTGRRLLDVSTSQWEGEPEHPLQPGDYFKFGKTLWYIKAPNGEEGCIDQTKHTVVVHEDGTITVSPSILIYPHKTEEGQSPGWHGYLERGVWRSC